jgi:hypothetical protein
MRAVTASWGHEAAPNPLIAIATAARLPPAHVIGVTVAIPFYSRQNGNL